MKKVNVKKVKLLMLKYVSQYVNIAKNDLAADWPTKGVPGAENVIKNDIKLLHGALFIRRSVEKQIPMPVKIQIPPREPERIRYAYKNGQKVLVIVYEAWCQNCNKLIDFGNKPSDACNFAIRYKKYCSHCGQKLWWPSC